MQWKFIPIELPSSPEQFGLTEGIFYFDLNKLAYVCYVEVFDQNLAHEKTLAILEKRRKFALDAVSVFAKNKWNFNEPRFLTLFILPDNGNPWRKIIPKPDLSSPITFFTLNELKYIVNNEESDPLLIWKFAVSNSEVLNASRIHSKGGNLSVFAAYKQNNYSIWPEDEERPDILVFVPSLSERYIRNSNEKRKEHVALFTTNGKSQEIVVYNYCDYAPFYREIGDVNRNAILLEDFLLPIWFINDQATSQHPQLISSQLEMLAFWLLVLESDLKNSFTLAVNDVSLVVKVILDSRFKVEMRPSDIPEEMELDKIDIPIFIDGSNVTITIPVELALWYAKPDNQGERHVVYHLLNSILDYKNGSKSEKLKEIINKRIPIGIAKMSSILTNAKNIQLETRNLPAYRKVQTHDVSDIQANLTRTFKIEVDNNSLNTKENRKKICSDIAKALYNDLMVRLKEYDGMYLLPMLINYHEACVQGKAIKQLDRPARIALFGADSDFILKEHHEEQERAKTSLAARCLIELIVALNMVDGNKDPNFDDIDKLFALMSEVIAWASLSDGIHLDLYDPEIRLLKCGRIQVNYSSINSSMFSFGINRTQIELSQYDSAYIDLFSVPSFENIDEDSEEVKEIEKAFLEDLGLSFLRLHDFLTDLVELTRSNKGSTISIDEEILFEKLKATKFNWKDLEIKSALNYLVLIQGWEIDKPPLGYRNKDTRPWYYNRALSFIRRPIAKLIKNKRTYYMWSYRHLYSAFENTYVLISEGIYWSPIDGSIGNLVKRNADRKGKYFRNSVHSWLKENSDFDVREEEVRIMPGAKLNSLANLGDVDILAIDHLNKAIYSLECKNTSESKSVHDFRSDLDQYMSAGGKEYIRKHIDRDLWLKTNRKLLDAYVKNAEDYQIISVLITAYDIPLSYMHQASLPIISFQRLKLEGIEALKELLVK